MSVEELNVEIDTTNDLSVDYKALKNRIIKSCKATGNGTVDFIVEFDKLMELVVELGVTPICSGLNAHRVAPEHIPYLNEYFKDENLSWFTSSKFFTCLSFIKTEYIDGDVKIESKEIKDITNDEQKENEILNLLKRNEVTPIGMQDVLEDLQRANCEI